MCHELAQIYEKDRMWTIKETIFAAGGLKSSVIYYDNILAFPRKLCRVYLPDSSTGLVTHMAKCQINEPQCYSKLRVTKACFWVSSGPAITLQFLKKPKLIHIGVN